MTVTTTTHLNFRGDARAALEHYRGVFGGELTVVTYADAHAVQDPAEADQVMWGQVASPAGFHVMAYDVPARLPHDAGTNAFFVSVRGADADEVTRYWTALADGATVLQDLAPAGWAPLYGMLVDRFGVTWVLDVAVAYAG
ncbi:VOC family protein [Cellulomonas shaoxiangyii]|uniref:VOC family protein n=1 Tax=Cellulomonas shaoxiangyii TaxID=2566013 RepID=A0A4P7SKE7_9CELL|nr:VOC family protein [Cellulomonas shaoxiangyii]QCB94660.1 VOC family protein [Cellulomonas shaoxiangyii]TGY84713.1 VOC family protein [Cellulomonas shaoxiangyii]